MMARLQILLTGWCAAGLCCLAVAAEPVPPDGADDATFSAWITSQRDEVEQRRVAARDVYDAQERVCWHRFAVNDCLHAARVVRRQQLDALRARDLQLNDLERQRRADRRLRAIAERENAR